MNIFAIEGNAETGEIDWRASARSQDNYRVVKMILESLIQPEAPIVPMGSGEFSKLS